MTSSGLGGEGRPPTLDGPRSAEPVAAPRAWLAVWILFGFYILSMMDRGVIALMITPIKQDLGISDVQIGLVQGFAFALLYSIAALPIGWAVDHYSRRKILFAGIFTWSLATAACGLVGSFSELFIARAFVGIGEAALIPLALSLIADLFPRHRLATATAVFTVGSTIGAGASFAVGGSVMELFAQGAFASVFQGVAAWRATFLFFGSIGIAAALLAFALPNPPDRARGRIAAGSRSAASMSEFWRFLVTNRAVLTHAFLAFPLLTCAVFAYLGWAAHYLELTFVWDQQKIGLIMGFIVIVGQSFGILCGGMIIDRAERKGVKAPYFTVPMVTTLIGGPLLVLAFFQSNAVLCILFLAIGAVVIGSYSSAHYAVLQLIAPPAFRGRLTALYIFVLAIIGTGFGPLLPPLANRLLQGDEHSLGQATALVIAILTPIVALILALGRSQLHIAIQNAKTEHLGTQAGGTRPADAA